MEKKPLKPCSAMSLALDMSSADEKSENMELLISKAFSTSINLNDEVDLVENYGVPTWPLRMERLKKTLRTAQKKGISSPTLEL